MDKVEKPSSDIYAVDECDFQSRVIEASHATPVLVDFWAEWCPPCIALAPALERVIAESVGRVKLAKVEVDENMRLAGHYRLRGFPTVILFHHGAELARFGGSRPAHWIQEWLAEHWEGISRHR
ncbi:MAG: thioredoxin fold domain-containing protein [Gammaproteobacteria bacterium]|nr:thioredoxin fold domain-containing protein [Gammaproteobacteria bacterium]